MHPLTVDCPKPLLPVGPWTLVEHQLSALERAGVRRVVLSTGYRHEDFEPLVERCRAKGVDLTCVVEATPLGTGGGLREALGPLRDADVVVVVTEVNSHAAMHRTKDILRKSQREAVFVRKASKSRLQQIIDQLTAGLMPEPCPC